MSILQLDTTLIKDPKYLGVTYSTYMHQAENVYELNFNESPEALQLYYSYLDVEERKRFVSLADKDTGIVLAEWSGDRAIVDEDRMVVAPYFYRDNVWMDSFGQPSLRFEMDLEESLHKEVE